MKCEKCALTAVVHLTEMVRGADGAKRAMEFHLCAGHATELGISGTAGMPKEQAGNVEPAIVNVPALKPLGRQESKPKEETTALAPSAPLAGGLAMVRPEPGAIRPVEQQACPACGMTWKEFKEGGKLGCGHDYLLFGARLEGVVKRAQENCSQHVGKVPGKLRQSGHGRTVIAARLRRELEQALGNERYEEAAQLRDQLKGLG